jgi:hypothetical protein
MSALTKFFFRNEVSCRSTADVIKWWESRRLPFNLAVGATGVFSWSAVQLILLMPPDSGVIPLAPSLIIPIVYGVVANVCYTGGWMFELWFRRQFGREMEPVGPTTFRYGFVFSIGLTLFPVAMASIFKLGMIVSKLF